MTEMSSSELSLEMFSFLFGRGGAGFLHLIVDISVIDETEFSDFKLFFSCDIFLMFHILHTPVVFVMGNHR